MRTLGAVNVATGDFDIWDAKYYSNDEWINFHAERQDGDGAVEGLWKKRIWIIVCLHIRRHHRGVREKYVFCSF